MVDNCGSMVSEAVALTDSLVSTQPDSEVILEAVEVAVVAAVEEESVEAGTAHKCQAFYEINF